MPQAECQGRMEAIRMTKRNTRTMSRTLARFGALLTVSAMLTGGSAARVLAQGGQSAPAPADYRIGPEDQLDIVVLDNTTLTRTVRVRPDGRITLPLINAVPAANLTPMELRASLTERFAKLMQQKAAPEVSVIVAQVHALRVSVLGNVNTPGRPELGSRTTVLDALAMAGGFNTYAKRDRVLIHRRDGSTLVFDYIKAVDSKDFKDNVILQPGDIIIVS